MRIALCYEQVEPARGGCSTYIADLARRLAADEHEVHLFASRWDARALPATLHYHPLPVSKGPRFLRPWRFGKACLSELHRAGMDVSMGFDKTWGQDVLYPQGGLHRASAAHNLYKYANPIIRELARATKACDLAHRSYMLLERRQYLREPRPVIVAISDMVRRHFQDYYELSGADIRLLHAAIDPGRFLEHDRLRRRMEWREHWGLAADETVALFAAMNYPLKGLDPLLSALRLLPKKDRFRLLVLGAPNYQAYESLARRLGVHELVRFGGYCADMRNGYFAADFLVHPTFYDPCSLVVLEALACGLPIVTTRYNGASELLTPGREGFVVDDPHDHAQLAWSIAQLIEGPKRAACAQAARRTSSLWTFEHHYQQLLGVLRDAAERKRAA